MTQNKWFNQACGMAMYSPDAHSASDKYSAYRSDGNGNLKHWS